MGKDKLFEQLVKECMDKYPHTNKKDREILEKLTREELSKRDLTGIGLGISSISGYLLVAMVFLIWLSSTLVGG